jgi:hypothetical protein
MELSDEDTYKKLLVLCAHDTHHDFFQPKETFNTSLQQGGVKRSRSTEDGERGQLPEEYARGELRSGFNFRDIDDKDEYINEIINNPIDEDSWDQMIENVEGDRSDLITKKVVDTLYDTLNEQEDIYSIFEMDDLDEAESMEGAHTVTDMDVDQVEEFERSLGVVGTDGTPRIPPQEVQPRSGPVTPPPAGGSRSSKRLNLDEMRVRNLDSLRKRMIYIIKKIKVWDTNIINLERTDPAAHDLNKELKDPRNPISIHKGAGLYTFYEWLLYSISEKGMAIKSNVIKTALGSLNSQPVPQNTEDASRMFIKNVETTINGLLDPDDFKYFVSDILKFIKYTTVPGFYGDISTVSDKLLLINPKTTINITSFVRKKWRSLNDTKFITYLQTLLGRKKITLTSEQMKNIDTLRNDIMNWWIENIYGLVDPSGEYAWERDWIDIIRGSTNITDEKLVDFFISQELKPRKGSTNNRGIFTGLNGTVERVTSNNYDITTKMLDISNKAYDEGAVGNNVAAISHYYSQSKNKPKWPSNIGGFLFQEKKKYNCNSVNVADPGSTCPKCDIPGNNTTDISLNVKDDPRISFKINKESGTILLNDLSNGKCEYSIKLPSGEMLTQTTSTAKDLGLSKTNILKKVMEYIKNQANQGQPQPNMINSEALNYYITNLRQDPKIKEIIQIFSLKLFGDFGQELLSVEQSSSKPTVFVGNDWISSIRYLFMKKHVVESKKSTYPWWGGFMHNSSCFLFYHQGGRPQSRPVSPVPQPGGGSNSMKLRTKSKKYKKYKKSKKYKRTKTKKTKRISRKKKKKTKKRTTKSKSKSKSKSKTKRK